MRAQVFKHADRTMHDRHFYDAYQTYQTVVQTAEEFAQAFPGSARGCELVGYLHVRRAIALSCHGNDMGEESGRKWHAQVSVSLYLPLALSVSSLSVSVSLCLPRVVCVRALLTRRRGRHWRQQDAAGNWHRRYLTPFSTRASL